MGLIRHDDLMSTLSPAVVAFERWLNPLLARILASPLHWLVSRWLLELRYTGRRSGRTFAVPLMYARHDHRTFAMLVGVPEAKTYWRNFTGDPQTVELYLRGKGVWAEAQAVTDGGPTAGALLRSWAARFPRAARRAGVPRATKPDSEFETAAKARVLMRVDVP